jgi:hypothetical protein
LSDVGYLAWLRKQRCACGCLKPPPSDAAHLRASSFVYDKSNGMGQRPDDRWALPLNHFHHMAQHFYGDELGWWEAHGVADPFALAQEYYARYQQTKNRSPAQP